MKKFFRRIAGWIGETLSMMFGEPTEDFREEDVRKVAVVFKNVGDMFKGKTKKA